MTQERMLEDLKHYTILEKKMNEEKTTLRETAEKLNESYEELDELTKETINLCTQALDLFTLEENGFFKKIAIPFGATINVVKDKLDISDWKVQLYMDCTYMEGEGILSLYEKGTVSVDFIFNSKKPFQELNGKKIHYIGYDKSEEILGFVIENGNADNLEYFVADCENVNVVFSEITLNKQ